MPKHPASAPILVGAVGVANIMLIAVLERRSEIGSSGPSATKRNVRHGFEACERGNSVVLQPCDLDPAEVADGGAWMTIGESVCSVFVSSL